MQLSRRSMLGSLALVPTLAAPAILNSTPVLAARTPQSGVQVPGIYRFGVGTMEVTAIHDGHSAIPTGFVPEFDADKASRAAARTFHPFNPEAITIPINGYVINTGKHLIAIDAGAPSAMGETVGRFHANLKAAGIDANEIDTILMTHLHADHVGGLVGAAGEKLFPNAELITSQVEWDFTHDDTIRAQMPEAFRGFVDLSRSLVAPYANQRSVFSTEKEIVPGITAVPLPGHTPGHSGFMLESEGESLLIWGDIIHLAALQFIHPEWGIVFDTDPAMAKQTRKDMLDRVAADRIAVTGMHLDFPGIGFVERSDDAYRFVAAPWQYAL